MNFKKLTFIIVIPTQPNILLVYSSIHNLRPSLLYTLFWLIEQSMLQYSFNVKIVSLCVTPVTEYPRLRMVVYIKVFWSFIIFIFTSYKRAFKSCARKKSILNSLLKLYAQYFKLLGCWNSKENLEWMNWFLKREFSVNFTEL